MVVFSRKNNIFFRGFDQVLYNQDRLRVVYGQTRALVSTCNIVA